MANWYKFGYKIEGDPSSGVKALKQTDKELDNVDKSQKKTTTSAKKLTSANKSLASSISNVSGKAAKYAAIGLGAAAAAGTAIVKSNLASIDVLAKKADSLGIATDKLVGYRFAAEQSGISNEKFDATLTKMSVNVAEAATGTGTAADALKALNINAAELIKLSPDQQIDVISDSMNQVENQTKKAGIAYDLFGKQGVALLNFTKNGSKGIHELAAETEKAGTAINRIDAAKIEAANDAMNRASMVAEGFGQKLTIQVAPLLNKVADQLFDLGTETDGVGKAAEKAFNFGIKIVGTFADGIHGINVLIKLLKTGFLGLVSSWLSGWDKIASSAAELANMIPGIDFDYSSTAFAQFTADMQDDFTASKKELDDILAEPLPSTALKQYADDAQTESEKAARVVSESATNINNSLNGISDTVDETALHVGETTVEAADVVEGAWEHATARIDTLFADAWKGSIKSFGEFKDKMLDGVMQLIAEVAHQLTTKKLVLTIGTAIGGTLGSTITSAAGGTAAQAAASAASGVGGLAGIGAALTSGLYGISENIASMLPTGFGGTGSFWGAAQPGAGGVVDAGYGTSLDGAGIDFASLGLGIAGSYVGGKLGNALGEGLFGKQAESGWGQMAGSVIGAIWGPLGATIGSFIGSMADVAFGGDGKKRANVGVQTGRWDDNVTASAVGASGLELFAKAKRTGSEGEEAAASMLGLFTGLDNALTEITRAAGIAVDFSKTSLSGKSSEAESGGPRDFFGAAGMNGIDSADLQAAPEEFVRAWIDEATKQFAEAPAQLATGFADALADVDLSTLPAFVRENIERYNGEIVSAVDSEFRSVVTGLQGTAEELLSGYASALMLKGVFDQGGQLFADIDGFRETFEILGDTFQREGEALGDTIDRLAASGGILQFIGVVDEFNTETAALGEGLADAVGGVENLAALASQFAQLFTTEDEALAALGNQVAAVFDSFGETFDRLGVSVPTTRDEFENLVRTMPLAEDGATELLAALLQIAPAFVAITPEAVAASTATDNLGETLTDLGDSLDDLGDVFDDAGDLGDSLDNLGDTFDDTGELADDLGENLDDLGDNLGDLGAKIAELEASVQGQAAALFGGNIKGELSAAIAQEKARIAAMNDAAKQQAAATNQQIKAANDLYKLEMSRYNEAIKASESLNAATDALALSSESTLTPIEKLAEAQAQFDDLVAAAQGGDAGAAQSAASFASTLLSLGRDVFASGGDYTDLFKSTNASLSGLSGLFGSAVAPTGGGLGSAGADTITTTATLEALLAQQAQINAEAQINARNLDLEAFSEKLGELALAKDESVLDLIAEMGLGLDDLAADLNFDGMIDAVERSTAYLRLIDTNNDGLITQMEAVAAGLGLDSAIVKAIMQSGGELGLQVADLLNTAIPGVTVTPSPGSATDDLYSQRKYKRLYKAKGGSLEYADWLAAGAGTFDEIGFGSGAMVSKPTRAWIAEAGQSEAVVPLNEFWNKFDRLEAAVIKLQAIQTAQTEQQFNVAKVQIEQGEDLRAAVNDGAKKTASALAPKRTTAF